MSSASDLDRIAGSYLRFISVLLLIPILVLVLNSPISAQSRNIATRIPPSDEKASLKKFGIQNIEITDSQGEIISLPRIIKVQDNIGVPGGTVTMIVTIDAEGNEAGVGFTMSYDPTLLTLFASQPVLRGAAFVSADSFISNTTTQLGRVGVAATYFNATIPPGLQEVAQIRFNISPSAPAPSNIAFGMPGDLSANSVSFLTTPADPSAVFQGGNLRILGPTAAAVTLSGRVVTAEGYGVPFAQIVVRNQMGEAVSTITNPFGFYNFDNLQAGETYFIEAVSKRYVFTPPVQVRSVQDDVTGVDFMAQE